MHSDVEVTILGKQQFSAKTVQALQMVSAKEQISKTSISLSSVAINVANLLQANVGTVDNGTTSKKLWPFVPYLQYASIHVIQRRCNS